MIIISFIYKEMFIELPSGPSVGSNASPWKKNAVLAVETSFSTHMTRLETQSFP